MDAQVSTQLKDLINKNSAIGVAVRKNPTVDEMAAALSIFSVLKNEGKNVAVVCPSEALVEHSRLFGIDKVKKDFGASGGDMTVSFPYQEGEIDKISYTLESGFLNIIVKSGPDGLSFSEKDVIFKNSEGYPTLLFVIGASRLSDLDTIYDPQSLRDTTVINIDNKPENQGYGDVSIVSPSSSSISEKVSELLLSMGYNLDVDVAQNLLIGIENATDNFQSPKTTPLAFEITGELIRKGAARVGSGPKAAPMNEEFIGEDEDFYEEDFLAPAPSRQPIRQQSRNPFMPRSARPQPNLGQFPQVNRQANPAQSQVRDLDIERKDRKNPSMEQGRGKKPPTDWLTPKIYKGSSNI